MWSVFHNQPFSSSYSLPCATTSPPWWATPGEEPKTFKKERTDLLKVSYTVVPEEAKKSCSLDNDDNQLKCYSFQVFFLEKSKLDWFVNTFIFSYTHTQLHHIYVHENTLTECFCDVRPIRQEEVKPRALQRTEGLGPSLHGLPLQCNRAGRDFLFNNIWPAIRNICTGARPLQRKIHLFLFNKDDKNFRLHKLSAARQFGLQEGPKEFALHRIHLWWESLILSKWKLPSRSWV